MKKTMILGGTVVNYKEIQESLKNDFTDLDSQYSYWRKLYNELSEMKAQFEREGSISSAAITDILKNVEFSIDNIDMPLDIQAAIKQATDAEIRSVIASENASAAILDDGMAFCKIQMGNTQERANEIVSEAYKKQEMTEALIHADSSVDFIAYLKSYTYILETSDSSSKFEKEITEAKQYIELLGVNHIVDEGNSTAAIAAYVDACNGQVSVSEEAKAEIISRVNHDIQAYHEDQETMKEIIQTMKETSNKLDEEHSQDRVFIDSVVSSVIDRVNGKELESGNEPSI